MLASSGFLTATLEQRRDEIIDRALHAAVVINALDSKGLFESLDPRTKDVSLAAMGSQSAVIAGLAHNRFENMEMGLGVEAMNEPLAALAEGTGGTFFHENNNLLAGFHELAAPPTVTYSLGVRLHNVAADGSYHKLKVTLANVRSASVQARAGYFAPTEKAPSAMEKSQSKFDREVMAQDRIDDFPVELSAENKKLPSGEMTVSVVAKLDISKLNFIQQ